MGSSGTGTDSCQEGVPPLPPPLGTYVHAATCGRDVTESVVSFLAEDSAAHEQAYGNWQRFREALKWHLL